MQYVMHYLKKIKAIGITKLHKIAKMTRQAIP
jgi:hypothetical protein